MIDYLHEAAQKMLFYMALYWHCHQLPERSFFVRGRQVPMCARCTGMVIGVMLFPLYNKYCGWLVSASLVAIFLIDSLTQLCGLRKSNNPLRFMTGIGFASSVLALLAAVWR
jgi:uncharacterized membrane protein